MPGARRTRAEVELQERDLAILQGLFESRLMTLTHITHLFLNGHSEAAKKRIQRLKEDRYIRERARRVYQPSILHLSRPAFAALSDRGMLSEYP
jgi:tRNA A-37 threonylcarbamoyl transferase component Bud32